MLSQCTHNHKKKEMITAMKPPYIQVMRKSIFVPADSGSA